jgi:hypothetical protein
MDNDGNQFDKTGFLVANPDFDETDYLGANQDVAAAVAARAISSGAEHYARFGINENRPTNLRTRPQPLKLPFRVGTSPSRRDKILANLNLRALEGIEIGALTSPLVRQDEGNILYIDHADTKTLKAKYLNDPGVDVANIVDVGAVWGSQTLQECIGVHKKVDYVVAVSHPW